MIRRVEDFNFTPRMIFLLFLGPLFIFGGAAVFFAAASYFPPVVSTVIHVNRYLVGQRSFGAVESFDLSLTAPGKWEHPNSSTVIIRADKQMILTSPELAGPVTLVFDGRYWSGFTHIAGRRLPVKFEVR